MPSEHLSRIKTHLRLEKDQAWIFGVCAGVAKHLNTDPAFVRVGTVIAGLFFPKITIAVYLVAWLLLDER